jgi:hypothetical protein
MDPLQAIPYIAAVYVSKADVNSILTRRSKTRYLSDDLLNQFKKLLKALPPETMRLITAQQIFWR